MLDKEVLVGGHSAGRYRLCFKDATMSALCESLRGWIETDGMSDDGRRKLWLMRQAADEIDRLQTRIEAIATTCDENAEAHSAAATVLTIGGNLKQALAAESAAKAYARIAKHVRTAG
jgi:hypothetical protein